MKHFRWLLLALFALFAVPHAAHAQAGVLLYCQNGVKQPGQGLPTAPASLASPCPSMPKYRTLRNRAPSRRYASQWFSVRIIYGAKAKKRSGG
jgi:hypothetical protein